MPNQIYCGMSIRISEPDEMELQFIGGGEARSPLWHTTDFEKRGESILRKFGMVRDRRGRRKRRGRPGVRFKLREINVEMLLIN